MKGCCCLDLSNIVMQDCIQNVSLNGNFNAGDTIFEWAESALNTSGTIIVQIETSNVDLVFNTTDQLTVNAGQTYAYTSNQLSSLQAVATANENVVGTISVIINYEI